MHILFAHTNCAVSSRVGPLMAGRLRVFLVLTVRVTIANVRYLNSQLMTVQNGFGGYRRSRTVSHRDVGTLLVHVVLIARGCGFHACFSGMPVRRTHFAVLVGEL